jgi:hypothetical protein
MHDLREHVGDLLAVTPGRGDRGGMKINGTVLKWKCRMAFVSMLVRYIAVAR